MAPWAAAARLMARHAQPNSSPAPLAAAAATAGLFSRSRSQRRRLHAAVSCVTLAAAQCARPCERRAREAASGPTAVAPLAARSRLHAKFSPRRWPRHHHCCRTNTTVSTVHAPLISAPAWLQCARLRSRRWQLGLDHEPSGRYRSSPSPGPCKSAGHLRSSGIAVVGVGGAVCERQARHAQVCGN